MRQVVLSNDDFGIHTEFTRAPENFKNASRRRGPAAGIAEQLDVHHCTVQFGHAWNAFRTRAVLFCLAVLPFFSKRRRQFFARWNLYFMLNANVVRQDDVPSRAIAEQADDGSMRAAENSNDAALGSLRSAQPGHTPELRKDVVAVHRVFDRVAGNEDVAVKPRHGLIRHNEAVAIMVEDEAALDLIAGGDLRDLFCWFGVAASRVIRRPLFGLASWEAVT